MGAGARRKETWYNTYIITLRAIRNAFCMKKTFLFSISAVLAGAALFGLYRGYHTTYAATATSDNELWGFVKSSDGSAISGAAVWFCYDAATPPTTCDPTKAATTDTNGFWKLSGPPAGEYLFWATTSDGASSTSESVSFSGGSVQVPDLIVESGETTGSVYGSISDASGNPVSGASVSVSKDDGTFTTSITTDTNGFYEAQSLSLGSYTVAVSPPSGAGLETPPPQSVSLTSDNPIKEVNFQLISATTEENGTIAGTVRDKATAQGVSGLTVTAFNQESTSAFSATTAADGTYAILLPGGDWEVLVQLDAASAYTGVEPPVAQVTVSAGSTVSGVDFSLTSGEATITGTLVDADGVLISTVTAWVYVEGASFGAPVAGGSFSLAVPEGTHTVNVWPDEASGYISGGATTVSVVKGETVSITLVLLSQAQGGRIEGNILDETGSLVTDLAVQVFAGNGTTMVPANVDKAAGRYVLTVPPGTWWIGHALCNDAGTSCSFGNTSSAAVTVTEGAVILQDITVRRNTATITVKVLKKDGTAFPSVHVEASSDAFDPKLHEREFFEGVYRFATTNSAGTATLQVPAGTYFVRAFASSEINAGINPPEQQVTVAVGQTALTTLRFKDVNATVSGQVLLEDGTPVAKAFVGAWSESGGFSMTTADAAGNFNLSISQGDAWHFMAGANLNGLLYLSDEVTLTLSGITAVSQNLVVRPTDTRIVEPISASHSVTEPFSATLDDGMSVACNAGCFGGNTDTSAGLFAASGSASVQINVGPDVTVVRQGAVRSVGATYDIEVLQSDGSRVVDLQDEMEITIPYDPEKVRELGVTENALQIAFFDTATSRWKPVANSVVNKSKRVVTGLTDHLTRFALVTPAHSGVSKADIRAGDIIRGPDRVKVYIVNANGYKRHIFNPDVFSMYAHLRWENIKEVSQATLDSYATSDLYRAAGDFRVYSLKDQGAGRATKHWLDMAPGRFSQAGYDWSQVFAVNAQERDYYESGASIK